MDRLYFLNQHLEGEPKLLIAGCLHMEPSEGYQEAKQILEQEYGCPHRISTAYNDKLMDWSAMKQEDSQMLRKFAALLNECFFATRSLHHKSVLDHTQNLQSLTAKLPYFLQNKWRDRVSKIKRQSQRSLSFKEFAEFVQEESESACDPIFGKDAMMKFTAATFKNAPRKSSNFAVSLQDARLEHCQFCKNDHNLDSCQEFLLQPVIARRQFLMDERLCFGCLTTGHIARQCRSKLTCNKCKKKHPTSMHIEDFHLKKEPTSSPETQTVLSTLSDEEVVLHPIIPVKVHQRGKGTVITYALYDSGSSGCFLSDQLQRELGAHGQKTTLQLRTMHGSTHGESTIVDDLIVMDMDGKNPINLPRCFTQKEIPMESRNVPRPETLSHWNSLKEATENMPEFIPNLSVGLLIGNNCPRAMQPLKVIPSEGEGPFAVLYPHGWTINGPIHIKGEDDTMVTTNCNRIIHHQCSLNEVIATPELLNLLDTDLLSHSKGEPGEVGLSKEDRKFVDMANASCLLQDGHFTLPLPFKESTVQMPANRLQAEQRAKWQRKKMLANPTYHAEYTAFMENLLTQGYARELGQNEIRCPEGGSWYLPHHGVIHPTKKKLRVVFDCSAQFRGKSLNSELLQGPNLTSSILGVLTRFRQEKIAFLGDIEAMFHQVRVIKEHQNFLRFLWWPGGNLESPLQEHVMCVHLFGASSSPAIANFALQQTANLAEHQFGPDVAQIIKKNFYVDDCLKSTDTPNKAKEMIKQLQKACHLGGFRIHKFSSNNAEVLESIPIEDRAKDIQIRSLNYNDLPSERTLGVIWNVNQDTITFAVTPMTKPTTRRGLLSMISSIYDPFGFLAPSTLYAKQILRELCLENISWDQPVAEEYVKRWMDWLAHLSSLPQLHIERCFKPSHFKPLIHKHIHVFCDASNTGYGAVAYFRIVDENGSIHCSFLVGKARLAPSKKTTIPRLELTAATVAVRIGRSMAKELDLEPEEISYHTDSTSVLHFISNSSRRFPIFIANRVQFIQDFSTKEQWQYVPTKHNPADLASRGSSIDKNIHSKEWLQGPSFLWQQEEHWPQQPDLSTGYSTSDDCYKTCVSLVSVPDSQSPPNVLIKYYSSWSRLRFAVAVYRKVATILQKKRKVTKEEAKIVAEDINKAEKAIIKFVQAQHYLTEIQDLASKQRVSSSSAILRLDPFMAEGLLRVGGRLANAHLPEETRHPLLLPKKSHVTILIIQDLHKKLGHVGRNHVIAASREKYWVVNANSTVRHAIGKCVTCRKLRRCPEVQKMGDLPADRCNVSSPFECTGVDFFGPFRVKQGRKVVKRYGVIFTCLASRSVHLKIASSLDSSSFINALRRFIARRGPVSLLRCDNGTNFVGAERELRDALKEMDNTSLSENLRREGISWLFNTPNASHHGGVWERLIRSVRSVLSGISREFGSLFDEEGLQTLMCEVEAILNSRPITSISSDPNDLEPLTPNHILTGKSKVVLPPPGQFQRNDIYMRKR